MNLTQFTNYSFRTLMYVALEEEHPVSIRDIANSYGMSYNHLKKVSSSLIKHGWLETVQGRYGGIRLAMSPDKIIVADVIRTTESTFDMFECFDSANKTCPLVPTCRLKTLLSRALRAFMAELEQATLADLIYAPDELKPLLGIEQTVGSKPVHKNRSAKEKRDRRN